MIDSGGTGLGLTIALNLLQAQGAQLHLHNRTGGGLEALVVMPAGPLKPGAARAV